MSRDGPGPRWLHLASAPNVLTIARLVIALAFPFVPDRARIVLLLAAMLTEYLDGVLARRFGWETRLGVLLDPIADKLLFAVVAGTYLVEGRLSWFALLALGVRDGMVLLGALWLAVRGRWRGFLKMKPRLSGKATTLLQYVVLIMVVLGHDPPTPLIVATLAVGIVAAVQYGGDFLRLQPSAPS